MRKDGVTSVTISGAGKSVTLGPEEKMEDNEEVRDIMDKVLDNAGVGKGKRLGAATKERTGQTSFDPETGEILTEEEQAEKSIITKVKTGEIPVKDRRLGESFEVMLTVRCIGKGREINKEGFEYPTQKIEITGINQEF